MQKIINDPSCVVDEMLQGYVKAHKDLVSTTENERVLKYKACPVEGKVGIVTGGDLQLRYFLSFIILRNKHYRKTVVVNCLAVRCSQIIIKD